MLPLEREGYWRDAEAFAEATEYQQALEWAWFAPLVRRLSAERDALAVDGLAGDILVHGKYAGAEVVAAKGAAGPTSEFVWDRLQRARSGRRLVARRMDEAISAAAREQVDARLPPVGRPPRRVHAGALPDAHDAGDVGRRDVALQGAADLGAVRNRRRGARRDALPARRTRSAARSITP